MVERVRSFNRAVTERVGALDVGYLGRGRPLGEAEAAVGDRHRERGGAPASPPPRDRLRVRQPAPALAGSPEARRRRGGCHGPARAARAPDAGRPGRARRARPVVRSARAGHPRVARRAARACGSWPRWRRSSSCCWPRSSRSTPRTRPRTTRARACSSTSPRSPCASREASTRRSALSADLAEIAPPSGLLLLARRQGAPRRLRRPALLPGRARQS